MVYKNLTYRTGDQLQKLEPQGPATDHTNWMLDNKIKNSTNIQIIMQSNLKNTGKNITTYQQKLTHIVM